MLVTVKLVMLVVLVRNFSDTGGSEACDIGVTILPVVDCGADGGGRKHGTTWWC